MKIVLNIIGVVLILIGATWFFQGIGVLPQNLAEAIDAFEADAVLRNAIGENLAQEFMRLKRMEWIEYSRHVSSWEVERYLEFF